MKNEQKILERSKPNAFSLVHFHSLLPPLLILLLCFFLCRKNDEADSRLCGAFMPRDCRRWRACAGRLGLHLETVYFGGGTPTTLEAGQLNTLLKGRAYPL